MRVEEAAEDRFFFLSPRYLFQDELLVLGHRLPGLAAQMNGEVVRPGFRGHAARGLSRVVADLVLRGVLEELRAGERERGGGGVRRPETTGGFGIIPLRSLPGTERLPRLFYLLIHNFQL